MTPQPGWYSVIRISGKRAGDRYGDWKTLDEAIHQALSNLAYGVRCKIVDDWGRVHGVTGDYAPDGWYPYEVEAGTRT